VVFRDFAKSVAEPLAGTRRASCLLIDANPRGDAERLAQAVALGRSTMVGLVDTLEERRLIERRRGEDRRTNGSAHPPGRSLLGRLKKRIEMHERRVAGRLTAAERDQLIALLEKLSD